MVIVALAWRMKKGQESYVKRTQSLHTKKRRLFNVVSFFPNVWQDLLFWTVMHTTSSSAVLLVSAPMFSVALVLQNVHYNGEV